MHWKRGGGRGRGRWRTLLLLWSPYPGAFGAGKFFLSSNLLALKVGKKPLPQTVEGEEGVGRGVHEGGGGGDPSSYDCWRF